MADGSITNLTRITGILSNATLQGDSAYDVAVKNGFVGTEEEWLASLKGDQGIQGIQGPIGPTGPTGERGNGISNIAMDSSGYISIVTTDGADYRFYVKGDKGDTGNKGDTGTGIRSVVLNSDYTLTITLTDDTTYTTGSIRGAKGDTGVGISDIALNQDHTLTVTMDDGTSYTTESIRGEKGEKGDKGDTGKGISRISKTATSGLTDTYTITFDDNTTSTFTVTNGQSATVSVTSDTDSDYRLTFTDVNGSIETPNLYSDVTASAKQLLSESYTLDQVPYPYRKSPDSDRAVEEIVGGTVGWNQLAELESLTATRCTSTVSDHIATLTVNDAGITAGRMTLSKGANVPKPIGYHKYLLAFSVKSSVAISSNSKLQYGNLLSSFASPFTVNAWNNYAKIVTYSSPTGEYIQLDLYGTFASGDTAQIKGIVLTDLTTMFGTTIADYIYSLEQSTAGAGVAKLKEWGFFAEDYYEYCEPTLRSVEGLVRKKTVGFNQWDEEWEQGTINSSGVPSSADNAIRSKNFNRCVAGATYYMTCGKTDGGSNNRFYLGIFWYDADKNMISLKYNNNGTAVAPDNAAYFKIITNTSTVVYGNVYNHDICINLSDSTRNGQYEPYDSHSYSLDSEVVLRGVFKLDENNNLRADGDIYPSDGNGSRRYGLVDLGTLDWSYDSANAFFNSNNIIDMASTSVSAGIAIICLKYEYKGRGATATVASADDRTIWYFGGGGNASQLRVKDTSYTDAVSFKTAMSGVMLVYELATPTTFTATPYHNPQIVGDTEEWVMTTGIVPVGHETKYFLDLRSRIEGLPDDFSTLIAPTEITNKASKNYTKGELIILNNQLYKVTSAIANNGTITINTNVRATTIAQEISPLVPPAANGTYVLKATVSNGNVTYSWVAE